MTQKTGRQETSKDITSNTVIENNKTENFGMHYAGFWIRFLASILDFIIIYVPVIVINLLLIYANISEVIYLIDVLALILILYLEGIKGATPGKMIIGLIVVNEKKEFIGFVNALFRYIGKILCGITLGIGYILIAFDEKKQGMHDKIAKTYVIYRN